MHSIWNRKDKQTKRRSMETKVESICQSKGLWNSVAHPNVQFTRSDQSSKYYRDFHSQPAGGVILIGTLYIYTMLTGNGHYDTWRRIMRLSLDLSLQITHPPQGKLATPLGSMSPFSLFVQWSGFLRPTKNQISESAVRRDVRFFVLTRETRKSNRLQMSLQRQHFLLSYWNPDCWFRAGLNPGPPAYQTGALLAACGGRVRITFAKLYTLPTTAIRVVGEYSRLSPLEGGGRAKDKIYISGKKN